MKPLSMLMAAALLAGCRDQTPTGVPTSEPMTVESRPAAAANARLAIDDVVDRIVPALGDRVGAQRLAAALRELRSAMDAGRVADGRGLARAAQAEVDRYARLDRDAAAEVDAIKLALAVVIETN